MLTKGLKTLDKKNISRKQALKQLGGLTIGSSFFSPLITKGEYNTKYAKENWKGSGSKQPNQPHIILLMADQYRADALGCAGNKVIKTPNIDAIAQDGALFNNAYSAVPSCTPARACLLTGLNPWNNGMLGYGRVARRYKYELPRMIREAGYYTYGIGKNHWFPQKSLHGFHGTLVDEGRRVEQDGFVSDYHDWFKQQAPGKKPNETGLDWNSYHAKVYALREELHRTYWTGRKAVDFIDNYDLTDPLYLKVSFVKAHSPYNPPQRFLDMYKNVDIPAPTIGGKERRSWDEKFAHFHPNKPTAARGNFGKAQAIKSRRYYYANITFVDEQIGQIIDTLKRKGMYENTLICFTADHGDMLGDHYLWRKTYPYEGSAAIPYILKWPAGFESTVKRGTKLSQPVGLQDFLPTFLQAAGQKIPKGIDGMSLLKLIQGNTAGWRKYIGMEHATTYFKNNYWAAVTDGKTKYIWFFRTGKEQFFDLEEDPGEIRNLIYQSGRSNEIQKWRNQLINHLKKRGTGFVKNNQLVRRKETMLYSPNYPHFDEIKEGLKYWESEVSLRPKI